LLHDTRSNGALVRRTKPYVSALRSTFKFLPVLIFLVPAFSQTTVNFLNQARNVDFSAFAFTRPESTGTALPATCQVGQLYFDSVAAAGENLYGCTATNVWTQLGGSPGSYSFSAPLSQSGNTVSISQATSSTDGYLSHIDWGTFNSKQPAGNYLTGLTGDITASGPGSVAATLATVNSSPGQCGDSAHVCQITTNGKGLVTAQSAIAIAGGGGSGNVSGPSSSTNTAFAEWNGTSGATLQNSLVTADANGDISTPGNISAGVGSGKAGTAVFTAGSSVSCATGSFCLMAPASISASFLWTLPNSDGAGMLTVSSDQISISPSAVPTPANSSVACTAGQWSNDTNYYYVCVAANTWKRVALSSF
jgi:hypothetical protein